VRIRHTADHSRFFGFRGEDVEPNAHQIVGELGGGLGVVGDEGAGGIGGVVFADEFAGIGGVFFLHIDDGGHVCLRDFFEVFIQHIIAESGHHEDTCWSLDGFFGDAEITGVFEGFDVAFLGVDLAGDVVFVAVDFEERADLHEEDGVFAVEGTIFLRESEILFVDELIWIGFFIGFFCFGFWGHFLLGSR